VLAYLFWHRPRDTATLEDYEQAQVAFHRSLAHTPPVGLLASACYRVRQLAWLPRPPVGAAAASAPADTAGAAYEDWYLVEDWAALGVLNEAAVGRGHRTTHDALARRFGAGAGGLYELLEGDREDPLDEATVATWVGRPPGSPQRMLAELLGDGMDPKRASLWRRQLVLGPAPEYCLLAGEAPAGVAPTRLPDGWTATTLDRTALWTR
jgi:hypothetical protein